MRTEHQALLERVNKHALDDGTIALPFSERLARDQGWPLVYAQRVITEYKRFAFLAVAAGHPVAPPAAVDEAWHLHLLHTDAYWNHFCPAVLGSALHHYPSRGGAKERDKFNDWYGATLASYRKFFEEEPPGDIWPASHQTLALRHVDVTRHWIVPKPAWVRTSLDWLRGVWSVARRMGCSIRRSTSSAMGVPLLMLALSLLLGGCDVNFDNPDSPLNMKGPDFLQFYMVTATMGFLLALFLRRQLRGSGGDGSDVPSWALDPYAIACLAGGKALTLSAALTNLYHRGLIQISSCFKRVSVTSVQPEALHPVEQAVYDAVAERGGTVREIRRHTAKAAKPLLAQLRELRLVPSSERACWATVLPLVVAAVVPALGVIKLFIGLERGRPVGYLGVLSLVVIGLLLWLLARPPLRTRKGDRVLARLRAEQAPLRASVADRFAALSGDALPLAIGLFGLGILSGTPLDELRKQIVPGLGSYSVDSGGGGCGGGGCGGGGCGGGCGGCGGD